MEKTIRLDFNCPKKLTDLTTTKNGLYCDGCAKPVVDFTKLGKHEIIQTLSTYSETPCVVISSDVVESSNKRNTHRFYWPKSAVLITLFLLFADVKAIFSQIKPKTKNDNNEFSIPAGYQRIELRGLVHDQNSKMIPEAELIFRFNGNEISRCKTDTSGKFDCVLENYGGIKEIDISVSAKEHSKKELTHIQILKPNPVMDIELIKHEEGPIIYGDRQVRMTSSLIGAVAVIERHTFSTRFIARQYLNAEIFDDILPPSRENNSLAQPRYPIDRLSYQTRVLDEVGNPIKNARINLWFSPKDTRWGITDENGNLNLRIHLNNSAYQTQLTISADGYRKKKVWNTDLQENNQQTFTLKRKSSTK